MNSCSITFNTKDNKEKHRYEVHCTIDGEKRLIGWSEDSDNDCLIAIIVALGGVDVEFVDTLAKVLGRTEPIGGGE